MVADVNINDARAAMALWLKKMMTTLNIVLDFNPRVFDSTEEIVSRARAGRLDAVALNIVEYRQIADVLDASQVVAEAGATAGPEQYVLLTKRGSGFDQLGRLRGHRLCVYKIPKMCVAAPWLSTLLEDGHFGPAEQFFGSMTEDAKVARVVLPVFFGKADACLTTARSFEMMAELNPQVAKDLVAIATSPPMTVVFYVFHKNFQDIGRRQQFMRVLSEISVGPAGRQLATLFQFEEICVRNSRCLTSALNILDASGRAHKWWCTAGGTDENVSRFRHRRAHRRFRPGAESPSPPL